MLFVSLQCAIQVISKMEKIIERKSAHRQHCTGGVAKLLCADETVRERW